MDSYLKASLRGVTKCVYMCIGVIFKLNKEVNNLIVTIALASAEFRGIYYWNSKAFFLKMFKKSIFKVYEEKKFGNQ